MNIDLSAFSKPNTVDGDYTGPDGLIYCGKCRAPKQMRLGDGKTVYCTCRCREEERDAEEAALKSKQREERRSRCLPLASMRQSTFAAADSAKHIETARKYVENWEQVKADNIGLMFWGNTGTGKSYAAQCIGNALIDRDINVTYITAVNLVSKLVSNSTDREEYIDKLCAVSLLIIDDIGAERDTAFAREQLCSVIDARVESEKPLIVTTNFRLDEMKNNPAPDLARIFDRLLAVCVPVCVTGESRRKTIAAEKLERAKQLLR